MSALSSRLLEWLDPVLVRIGRAIADRMVEQRPVTKMDYSFHVRPGVNMEAVVAAIRERGRRGSFDG